MRQSKVLCIYHGGCDDGLASACVVREALGNENVEFYPGVYQLDPPPVTDRHVILVDFSYKRPVLEKLIENCKSLLVLDHHKTAQEDLAFLPRVENNESWTVLYETGPKAAALFNMDHCGASLAFEFFNPNAGLPIFLEYIKDRDLWLKRLPNGDEFTIALRSYPQDLDFWWDNFYTDVINSDELIAEGKSLQRYYRLRVEELKKSAYLSSITSPEGNQVYTCMVANAPYFAASEVAGELCETPGVQFGMTYFEVRGNQFQHSLRSRGDFDVSAIAKWFGGGGHKNAAGFTTRGEPVHKVG